MPLLPLLDLATDLDGDLLVGHNGDLLVARDLDVLVQEAVWRLKTFRGDWQLEPACGSELETLVGEPNTRETGQRLESMIEEALLHDGFFETDLTGVRAFPVNREELAALIALEFEGDRSQLTVTLDLKEGAVRL